MGGEVKEGEVKAEVEVESEEQAEVKVEFRERPWFIVLGPWSAREATETASLVGDFLIIKEFDSKQRLGLTSGMIGNGRGESRKSERRVL
ncbi:MAG: hypothetical protein NTX53_21710 [candidate division WOR-3 bacterium]|nr:hypothetical protein [candidate division WOR-3 bacterium]